MMRKLYPTLVLLLTFFITTNAQFTKLLDLYDAGNGTDPLGGLVSDGTYFYGTTQYGGLYDKGTIYKVRPDGTGYVRLLNFDGTTTPRAPLNTLYYDGTFLYGVTLLGGANNKGVVYKIKTDGTAFSILLDFNTSTFGEIPRCSLISDGIWLYGTTFLGGSNTYGGFFKVKLDGTASAAYPIFNTTGGYSPATGLVSDGTALYGITSLGGTNGVGTIYKVLGDGTGFTKLFDMNSSVTGWNNGVIFGSMVYDGTFLYGVCRVGGANNLGTIFKIQTNGTGFVKLHDFTLATGTTPQSSLKLVGNTLYGMTSAGGANDKGVVFKINTDGSAYTVMHDFAGSPDGATPINDFYYDGTWLYAPVSFGGYSNNGTLIKIKPDGTGYGLVFDFSGISGVNPSTHGTFAYDGTSLYALTTNGGSGTCTGGCGTAFKIKPDGTYGSLYTFITSAASGRNPKGSLLYDGTYLYGTTESSNTSWGSIFKMLPDGSDFTKIYDFGAGTGLIGYSPTGSLVSDGTYLYGTTKSGGTNSKGTLFKIMPDGTNFSKIFDFSGAADGASPQGSLLYDGAYLYGTTALGGTTNNGTVFKILPNGTGYTRLVDFDGTIGTQPVSSLITDGTWLYGTIPNGAVYKVRPDGTGFTVLHQFTGSGSFGDLARVGTWLYGTTSNEGQYGYGTVFKLKTDGTGFETLFDFEGTATGAFPAGSIYPLGNFLYGMTTSSGLNNGGTVYKLCPGVRFSQSLSLCPGESVNVGIHTYNVTGVYYDTLTAVNTCDSIITTNLTINQPTSGNISASICQGQSYFFNGANRTTAGAYLDTLVNAAGCDSVITLNLSVKQNSTSSFSQSICQGQSYFFNGANRTTAGAYLDTLVNAAGCDSIITLNLTVNQPSATTLNNTICFNSSFPFNGQNLTTAGTYYDTLTNIAGCDSLITLHLSLNSFVSSSFNVGICNGDSYFYNGQNISSSGAYADTLLSSGGCDSIVTLNLTVNNSTAFSFNQSICSGSSFDFNGQNLTAGGIYKDTLVNSTGCDSVITVTLTVNNLPVPTIFRTSDTLQTQSFVSYQWLLNNGPINGGTTQKISITQNGNYRVIVTDANGCSDTSVVLNVMGVGIENLTQSLGVKLYPNPNTGTFMLEFTDDVAKEVEISDAVGRVVMANTKVEKQKQFNLNEYATGIYFLHIREHKQIRSLKFSVVR